LKITFTLLLIAYFALHSILASKGVKSFLQKSIILQRVYRIFFNVVSLLLLLPLSWNYLQLEKIELFQAPIWLTSASYLLLIIGIILLALSLRQYDLKAFSGWGDLDEKQVLRQAKKLQITGLNNWVRHPLYFSMLLIVWALFFAQATDILLLIAMIVTIYIYIGTLLEEQKLIEEFGAIYIKYQQEVPMLIPHFSIIKNTAKSS